jgi:hypothetical protein
VADQGGHMAHALPVHVDGRRRHCFKCGGNHVAMWCRVSQRPAGSPPNLWSTCKVAQTDAAEEPPRRTPQAAQAAVNAVPAPAVDIPARVDALPPAEDPGAPPAPSSTPAAPAAAPDASQMEQVAATPPLVPPLYEGDASALLSNSFTFNASIEASATSTAASPPPGDPTAQRLRSRSHSRSLSPRSPSQSSSVSEGTDRSSSRGRPRGGRNAGRQGAGAVAQDNLTAAVAAAAGRGTPRQQRPPAGARFQYETPPSQNIEEDVSQQ